MTKHTKDQGKVALGRRIVEARLAESYRREREMTQAEIAEALGVTPLTVSRWEAGTKAPELSRIPALAAALKCDPGWLTYGPPALGLYAGRGDRDRLGDAREVNAPARAPRGPKPKMASARAYLPAMWWGESALTDAPIMMRERRRA